MRVIEKDLDVSEYKSNSFTKNGIDVIRKPAGDVYYFSSALIRQYNNCIREQNFSNLTQYQYMVLKKYLLTFGQEPVEEPNDYTESLESMVNYVNNLLDDPYGLNVTVYEKIPYSLLEALNVRLAEDFLNVG